MSSPSTSGEPDITTLVDLVPRRRRRLPRGKQVHLNRELIARTAIDLADSEGPEAISMRRIATRLGVGTMTLYGYVADRDALLAYMLDLAFADAELPNQPSGNWRADLELLAGQFRAICLRHSWLPSVLGTSPYLLAPQLLRGVEFCLASLEPFGMDVQYAAEVLRLLNNFVIGVTLRESTQSRMAAKGDNVGYAAAVAAYLQQVILSRRYPVFSKLARIILDGRDIGPDDSFDMGLRILLDGVAAHVVKPARTEPSENGGR